MRRFNFVDVIDLKQPHDALAFCEKFTGNRQERRAMIVVEQTSTRLGPYKPVRRRVLLGLLVSVMFLVLALTQNVETLANDSEYLDLGSWNIVNLRVNLTKQWSAFGEGQLRSLAFYDNFHYFEYKGGVNYRFDQSFSASVGLGHFRTYREGGTFVTPVQNDELRLWLQMRMHQELGRLNFEHRYRYERRYTTNGVRNRYRYRLNLTVPINTERLEAGAWYASAWNELFFTNRAPYFERNRFFVGVGYEFSDAFQAQLGWVNQFDYRINDEIGRDFLQVSFLFELDALRRANQVIPGSLD